MAPSMNPYQPPAVEPRQDRRLAVEGADRVGPMLSISVFLGSACLLKSTAIWLGLVPWTAVPLPITCGALAALLLGRSFQIFRQVRKRELSQ